MNKQKLLEEFFSTIFKIRRLTEKPHNTMSIEQRIATMLQLQALGFLKHNSASTVSQLSKFLATSSSSTAQLTDRLFNSGWIKREADKKDRRVIHLSLTPKGEKHFLEIKRKKFAKMGKFLRVLPETDLEQLVTIMSKVLKKIEEKK